MLQDAHRARLDMELYGRMISMNILKQRMHKKVHDPRRDSGFFIALKNNAGQKRDN
jgi:hypothetical protein